MLKRYGDFLFFFSSVRLSSRLDAQADAQPHFCVDVRWDRGSAGLDLDVEGWGCRELRRVFVVARVFVVLLPSDPQFWLNGRYYKTGIDFWTTRSFFPVNVLLCKHHTSVSHSKVVNFFHMHTAIQTYRYESRVAFQVAQT